jgi:hypothetical protein
MSVSERMTPTSVRLEDGRLRLGERLTISFQRTLRIPDRRQDDRNYPLPPGLGLFPLHRAADYAGRVPQEWLAQDAFFFPMYRREAMWIGFDGAPWKPNAVKVGLGGVNALSGAPWDERLRDDPQDYLVVPDQPWLDGINAGEGFVRQFVAVPLGEGLSVEAEVTRAETTGGIQLLAFEPQPGRFPDVQPPRDRSGATFAMMPGEMGLGAGGRMRQLVYPDPYGVDAWDVHQSVPAFVHLVNTAEYRAITGAEPPGTPVDARVYTEHGLPWFDLYDEEAGDIAASPTLERVRSVGALEGEGVGGPPEEDEQLEIPADQVRRLRHGRDDSRGGVTGPADR